MTKQFKNYVKRFNDQLSRMRYNSWFIEYPKYLRVENKGILLIFQSDIASSIEIENIREQFNNAIGNSTQTYIMPIILNRKNRRNALRNCNTQRSDICHWKKQ